MISSQTRRRNTRLDLIAIVALTALVAVFFSKMLFTNLIIARGDLFNYFYPYRDYAAAALREGRVPLWDPYLFMGAPFLANSQVGFFYPFNLISSWPEVTRAVNLDIVAHIWIAAIGAYAFARHRLHTSSPAAMLGGVSFGLGGYLGAQVEHFNQLQALAWLPWLWLMYDRALRRRRWLDGLPIALMILAGHTQSVFIALVGLIVYALWPAVERLRMLRSALRLALRRMTPLVVAIVAGVLLSAVQLLPTLELARFSPRAGGLPANEAVSFSLDPRLIGRALLPDYESALPDGSEFTAFSGVSALTLALCGAAAKFSRRSVRALAIVAALGLFFALGGFNPIYYLLVKVAPGFGLFRAPARWLALFAFGGSMLAAIGADAIARGLTRRKWIVAITSVALLIGSTFLSAGLTPAGAAGPIQSPGLLSFALWIAALLLAIFLASRFQSTISNLLLFVLCLAELFIATRGLPYNARLTAPDALTDLRPSTTQLLVGATATPPARVLSISDILFDPGDSAELESIFADQLSPDAYYDLLVASKQKEIVAPNLPLYYRLFAVDGYDGGLLPLRAYLALQRLFLPPESIQPDGRLREQLKSIPDARWLDLMNVKYVITDKARDRWLDGVFYDLQFATRIEPGEEVSTDQLPSLEADALGIVYSEPSGDATLAEVEVTFVDGSTLRMPLIDDPVVSRGSLAETRLRWGAAKRVSTVKVRGMGGLTLHGAALIDERSQTFQSFVLAKGGRFRLAHSGDVKVYENVDALPRAFVAPRAQFASNGDEAIALMQRTDFDPAQTVVIEQSPVNSRQSSVASDHSSLITHHSSLITAYQAEYVALEVDSTGGYLVLSDAWYPGWTATVDGEPVDVLRADVYFRALPIAAGQHHVELRYEPQTFRIGAAISLLSLALVLLGLIGSRHPGRTSATALGQDV